jgi:beta-lactam-binding protein with PASTA domain
VVTEQAAAATRPTMIDLTGLTYSQAKGRLQSELSDVLTGGPITAPDLSGMTVSQATQRISG